ncbi:MAG: hypothetical protein K1W17_10015 [Oscillospiraceae bacterium]
MKKIASFILCAAMIFSVLSGTFFADSPFDFSITSEASEYNKTMLPYCYKKLTDEEKLAYLKMRTAFIDHREFMLISIPVETIEKLTNIMMYADAMTSFDFPVGKNVMQYYYNESTQKTSMVRFNYVYSKEDYDRIIKKSDKAAMEIISEFTDDTSDYEKIKYIHDYIVNETSYVINDSNNSAYDVLVLGEAKCDGYAHAFDYLCAKAGIRSMTVSGYARNRSDESEYHAWNKVYCGKKWYNVDVTWDDPETNLKNNLSYKYFMVSDEAIGNTHVQTDNGFYIPKADSDGADYYHKYGFYADTLSEAKNIFADKIAKAAKKGKNSVTVRLSDKGVYDEVMKCFSDAGEMLDVMDRASQMSGGKIITDGCSYHGEDDCMYTVTIYFYFKGGRLSDYFKDIKQLDGDTLSFLKEIGLKEE